MLDLEQFAEGLIAIGLRLQKPVDSATIRAYYADLRDETTLPEWRAFVPVAVKRYRWEFFPSVPKMLEALEEFRSSLSSDVAALPAGRLPDVEERRAGLITGVSQLREALRERGFNVPDSPVAEMEASK